MYNVKKHLDYSQLTKLLKYWNSKYPNLCFTKSIGKTLENRDILLLTITQSKTGQHNEKPAYWIDGNTHASEITGCHAALYTASYILSNYEQDSFVSHLLDNYTFYIVPRICIDAVELFLKKNYRMRSTPFLWPEQDNINGLIPKDIDDNGHILKMRQLDPNGMWKISKKDPRIMIPRDHDDWNSQTTKYYKVFTEGIFNQYNEFHQIINNSPYNLDMNRQYPANWLPEGEQNGSGPYPLSQPESKAIVQAIVNRPNIVGAQSFHTYGGVIFRPYCSLPDSKLHSHDLYVYDKLGYKGQTITGYSYISAYHDYKYYRDATAGGYFCEWAFHHKGIFAFTNEIWHIAKEANIDIGNITDWYFRNIPEDKEVKLLKWCDKNLKKNSYFLDWAPFDHPQLGPVEIGGWKYNYTWINPPNKYLEKELKQNMKFVLSCAAASPKVQIKNVFTEIIGYEQEQPIKKLSLIIENIGFLPTYVSKRALQIKAVKKPKVSLTLHGNVKLKYGSKNFEIDHLEGKTSNYNTPGFVNNAGINNDYETLLEWIAIGKGKIKVTINFERAGIIKHIFS